jgi:hypothetical protein
MSISQINEREEAERTCIADEEAEDEPAVGLKAVTSVPGARPIATSFCLL